MDPVWAGAQNELNFVNSLRMKFSVIIGIFHMLLGNYNNNMFLKKQSSRHNAQRLKLYL